MTTIATDEQKLPPAAPDADAGTQAGPLGPASPPESAVPVDMGLLVTLNSRMHCRAPMQRVDPQDVSIRQPVYVNGTWPSGGATRTEPGTAQDAATASEYVVSYRCACGFTIDAPAMTGHALAS